MASSTVIKRLTICQLVNSVKTPVRYLRNAAKIIEVDHQPSGGLNTANFRLRYAKKLADFMCLRR